jgi:hypothetical protein
MPLERLVAGIWTATAPLRLFGVHLGTRMTVVRLASGALLLHSPVPLVSELRSELDRIGPVEQILCPNLYHHLFAKEAVSAYPRARLFGPRALHRKRPDLSFSGELAGKADPEWNGELIPIPINGSLLHETVFFHPASQTLISSDLIENFDSSPHWGTRLYLKAAGLHGRPGFSRLLRVVYRDRRAARTSIDQLLELDFERIVLAHGRIMDTDPREALRASYTWLS